MPIGLEEVVLNSDMTWQRYKLNLRNSLLFAEIFNATFLFGLNDPFKPFAKLRFFYFTPNI